MKVLSWFGLALFTVLLSFVLRSKAIANTPTHYTDLEFEPLPEIELPDYTRYKLDNGMVVYLVEDRDLPLISGNAIIRTGTRLEPADKIGLAELTGAVIRSGGTEKHSSAELNTILEQKAASVETSIGETFGSASFSTLTEDLETVFPLFTEVMRQPAFAPEQLAIAKNKQQGLIARRNDDPGSIADREFYKVLYGKTSPYARTVEYDTLNNISRQDIIDFYQTYVRPENVILGITGDFVTEQMIEQVQNAFGNWQVPTPIAALEAPIATQRYNQGIFAIDRPQQSQSSIIFGHIGGQENNPDYPALNVLNTILSGNNEISGRLFNEVRSRQGLAYHVVAYWSPMYDYDGIFYAEGKTKTNSTVPFIKSVTNEIKRLRNELVTEQELEIAKESILNSFVFEFQDPSQTLDRLMEYEYFDYPEDFLFEYRDKVQNTTREDILNVAQKYLKPDRLATIVVGNVKAMNPPLSNLNQEINLVDVSIPQPANSSN
jgi:zinc protease